MSTDWSAIIVKWAESATRRGSAERGRLVKFKVSVVESFLTFANKKPDNATRRDVRLWREHLSARLMPKSVYDRLAFISSFYKWYGMLRNPVKGVRPGRPYSSYVRQDARRHKLNKSQLDDLLRNMREEADSGDLAAKRDYAMLLVYVTTGMRREVLAKLRTSDIRMGADSLTLRYQARIPVAYRKTDVRKIQRLIREPEVLRAVKDYLTAAKRIEKVDVPVWTGHAIGQTGEKSLTIPAFVKNLKKHAARVGLESLQLSQVRTSYLTHRT